VRRHRQKTPKRPTAVLAALTLFAGLLTVLSASVPAQAMMMIPPPPIVAQGAQRPTVATQRAVTITPPSNADTWGYDVSSYNYGLAASPSATRPDDNAPGIGIVSQTPPGPPGTNRAPIQVVIDIGSQDPTTNLYLLVSAPNVSYGLTSGWSIPLSVNGPGYVPPGPAKLRVASLGDSVASGEGTRYRWHYVLDTDKKNGKHGVWNGKWVEDNHTPTWEPVTDNTPAVQDCHRSTDGYPYKVANALDADSFNVTCSGASAGNGVLRHRIFNDGQQAANPQLGIAENLYDPPNSAYDAFKPDVVTLTLGANDVDFADILEACYKSAENFTHFERHCDKFKNLEASTKTLLAQQKANLETVITEIIHRGQVDGKVPLIVVTTYYDPFPDPYATCRDIHPFLNFGLSKGEVTWLQKQLKRLNQNIWDVAKAHPEVTVVPLDDAFKDHKWCSKDPWAYGASIKMLPHQEDNPSPFHPTWYGQTVIASKVTAAIKQRLGIG